MGLCNTPGKAQNAIRDLDTSATVKDLCSHLLEVKKNILKTPILSKLTTDYRISILALIN